MRTEITPGQTSDYMGFDLVMANNLPEPSVLLADRGYDADRALLRKSPDSRGSPFPGRTYPMGSVTGIPSAV